jgi:nucleotide-binding universal stress UspA family protein
VSDRTGTLDSSLLLAAERAVDAGASLLRHGRLDVGSMVPKGDRDYATEVDLRIEETIRAVLDEAAPDIAFLGEEEGERDGIGRAMWVLDPISRGLTGVKALGSVSERVAHRASCSVLIVRRKAHPEPEPELDSS